MLFKTSIGAFFGRVYTTMRESRTRKEHQTAILNLFLGEVRPLPDPLLFLILRLAGLASIGRHLVTYSLFFPRLLKRHEPVDKAFDVGVPPK